MNDNKPIITHFIPQFKSYYLQILKSLLSLFCPLLQGKPFSGGKRVVPRTPFLKPLKFMVKAMDRPNK